MTENSLPEAQQILEWIQALDEEVAKLQKAIDPIVAEQTTVKDRRRLLADLLVSFDPQAGARVAARGGSGGSSAPRSAPARRSSASGGGETIGARVRRQVEEILTEAGGQMQINDIHAAFIHRGYEVPGQGRPANITIHLSGSPTIVSPARGVYELRSSAGEAADPEPEIVGGAATAAGDAPTGDSSAIAPLAEGGAEEVDADEPAEDTGPSESSEPDEGQAEISASGLEPTEPATVLEHGKGDKKGYRSDGDRSGQKGSSKKKAGGRRKGKKRSKAR
jgi:hypothetical protein